MRTTLLAILTVSSIAAPAAAAEVGLIQGTFAATTATSDCASLLVTGQFVAPTPGYTLSLAESPDKSTVTVFALDLTATPPSGVVAQVLTTMPVTYDDPDFDACPYGVAVHYEGQVVLMGLMVANAVDAKE